MKIRRGDVGDVDSEGSVDCQRDDMKDDDQTILAYARARQLIVDCGLDCTDTPAFAPRFWPMN